jgi:citronellol/citronellal dehydrogenase
MSLCTLGLSEEVRMKGYDNIGVNCLWPKTTIATAATQNVLGGDSLVNASRTPQIMADAAYVILTSKATKTNGNFFYDDEVLLSNGVTDLSIYNVSKDIPQNELTRDFFI